MLAFSGNSNSKASESRIEIYEVSSWKKHNSIEILNGQAYSLLFQHDDRGLIVCGGECVPLGQNSCQPTGRIWLCATSSKPAVTPLKNERQFGYFNYAKLLADGKQFVVSTDIVKKNRVVSQLQVRDAKTGAVISSIDSEVGADIRGLAVHSGTSQIVMCSLASIKLMVTSDSAGTPVYSRTVSNEAW